MSDKPGLSYNDVLGQFQAIVDESPDYVYERQRRGETEVDSCFYVHYQGRTQVPGCIIGHWLHRVHDVPLDYLSQCEGRAGEEMVDTFIGAGRITVRASEIRQIINLVDLLQGNQDEGHTWSCSLERAKAGKRAGVAPDDCPGW